ncbi:MAG TPA: RHS repeat-associated core domain-containing protein [Chthoniobacterales bacterium]|nr:RHS repeat-associated core domain-containing protein [Chthoniobacterales bacterium]
MCRSVRSLFAALFLVSLLPAGVSAQLGNDNPTGISGMYNGNVNTAGSYDPYTGNATRSITDITVAGAVGAYPLAFTRTMNTRYNAGSGTWEMGTAGSWRHNYQWSIEPHVYTSSGPNRWSYLPNVYTVNYPDGRRLSFSQASNDTRFRAGSGISDRFQQLTNVDGGMVYVLLPDGGKIAFEATVIRNELSEVTHLTESLFTYELVGIIDPHGQTTTITYPGDGSMTITEPAGRWLKLWYTITPWMGDSVLTGVQASDGRSVTYNYGGWQPAGAAMYSYLGNIQYRDTAGGVYATAIYFYTPGNIDPNERPLLAGAIDPMYSGPMWSIGYTYVSGSSGGVYGQIQSENYLDPATGAAGQVVSSVSVNGNSRTETRGDGSSRTFNYIGGKLASYTDFKGQTSYISYDGNGFSNGFTDARGNTTTTSREGIIGAVSVLTHADQSAQGYAYWYRDGGPYFVQIRGDERGHNTYFTRDTDNFQLTRIDYPDYPNGAYETFAYNGFGQVYSHRMPSGGTETKYYDGRGMMWAYNNPDGTSYYYYDGLDRLEHTTDPRGNCTWFQYNARGQVTRVTHADGTYVQMSYDNHGDRISVTDELNHTTSFAYDDYKRVLTVTNPVGHTATFCYALDWVNPLLHTTNSVKYVISPMGKNVVFDYDANLQRVDQVAALGTPDEAWTLFEYDSVGNLTKVTDPLWHATTFGYDNRDRPTTMTDALGYVTTTNYDVMGNKTWIKRATGTAAETILQFPDYDSMNRLTRQIDERGVTTTMGYDLAGNLAWNNDGNANHYSYEYDALNRRKKMTYPDGSTEEESYDAAGNRATHKNRAGNVQTFFYDSRNRQTGFDWNDGFTPQLRTTYDAASRPTQIWNWDATIDNTFFDDNKLASQTEVTGDYGDNTPRTISYTYDADGNRGTITHNYAGITYNYHYTNRNQLKDINYQSYAPMIAYQYDKAGNRTLRTPYNGAITEYAPVDALNRSSWVRHTFAGGQTARYDYAFDEMGRRRYEQRNGGPADGYSYDQGGEVVGEIPNGTLSNGTVSGTNLPLSYDGAGNRTNTWGIPYSTNNVNQYTSVGGAPISCDANGNIQGRDGWTYTYDAQNRLRSATKGTTSLGFYYDGLNRQITRGVNTGSGWDVTFSVWDGWTLREEWGLGNVLKRLYFWGGATDELVCAFGGQYNNSWFTQDGRGNTSHISDDGNNLVERYTYGLSGEPQIWDPNGNARSDAITANRFMFQGRDYLKEGAIYDYRNRFYLPSLGRFLQPDPIGFRGDRANIYRFCGGDPVNRMDPFGLESPLPTKKKDGNDGVADYPGVEVTASEIPGYDRTAGDGHRDIGALDRTGSAPGEGGSRDSVGGGGGDRGEGDSPTPQPSTPPTPVPSGPPAPEWPPPPLHPIIPPFPGFPPIDDWRDFRDFYKYYFPAGAPGDNPYRDYLASRDG